MVKDYTLPARLGTLVKRNKERAYSWETKSLQLGRKPTSGPEERQTQTVRSKVGKLFELL